MRKLLSIIFLLFGQHQADKLTVLRRSVAGHRGGVKLHNSSLYGQSNVTVCFRFFQEYFVIPGQCWSLYEQGSEIVTPQILANWRVLGWVKECLI